MSTRTPLDECSFCRHQSLLVDSNPGGGMGMGAVDEKPNAVATRPKLLSWTSKLYYSGGGTNHKRQVIDAHKHAHINILLL